MGSGKSTIGKMLEDWFFVNAKDFYLPNPYESTLSSGEKVADYENSASVDWDELNFVMKQRLGEGNVVLVTSLPLIEKYGFAVDYPIRLCSGQIYSKNV